MTNLPNNADFWKHSEGGEIPIVRDPGEVLILKKAPWKTLQRPKQWDEATLQKERPDD
jgi:hypothetical protein